MPISPLSGQESLRAAAAAAALRRNTVSAAASTSPTRAPDKVSISDKARALAAARQPTVAAPVTRDDQISAIKASIAAGTYSVDSRQLASAMVNSVSS